MIITLELLQLFGESADGAQTGVAPAAEGTTGATNTAVAEQVDVDAEFDALVAKGGKYADAFNRKAQANFNGRYKEFKQTEERANALQRFVDTIAGDYADVDKNDLDALEKAYLTDERRFADKAYESGKSAKEMANDDYTQRRLAKYEADAKAEKERKRAKAEAEKFYEGIAKQEKEMLKKYPDFNLNSELLSDDFKNFVKNGASLEAAYWATHKDDLVGKVVKQAQTATADAIAKKGNRPVENAASTNSPSVSKVDISKLSYKEFMKFWNGT